jgi:hypothetical protein
MDTKTFVDRLFSEYEETPELGDFKEELLSNLEDRIASLSAKGMEKEAAFAKASGELGDISALADQISLRKKQEILQDAYMGVRKYLKPGRVAFYVAAGAWVILGGVIALAVYFSGENQSALEAFWEPNKNLVASLGCLLAFIPPAAAAFTFLGLTQETASRYPRPAKRGIWYALGAAALAFGAILFPTTYFAADRGIMEAIASLIPFFIPGLALLIFLVLTEKDHLKPWARSEKDARDAAADRFGMVSGAIWIFAAGFFIVLGLLVGFRFSWPVFVFAAAVQLAARSMMMKNKSQT